VKCWLSSSSLSLVGASCWFAGFPVPTAGAVQSESPIYHRCMQDAVDDLAQAALCNYAELNKSNDTLNAIYQDRLRRAKPAGRARLRWSERRWMRWRDAQCKAETVRYTGAWQGYEDSDLMYWGCLVSLTQKRINWLKDHGR
jgi:uncharacterized protein YecT (DUF1311 family)